MEEPEPATAADPSLEDASTTTISSTPPVTLPSAARQRLRKSGRS
jgi:hypothetical protein